MRPTTTTAKSDGSLWKSCTEQLHIRAAGCASPHAKPSCPVFLRSPSNGFLHFTGAGSATDGVNSDSGLIDNRRIAPLWDDLRTDGADDDIYVDTTITGQVTIRWDATNKADNSDVNFAVTLFDDGRVRFDYGAGNTNLTPTVGISLGDGLSYDLSIYNNAADLTSVNSVDWDTVEFVTRQSQTQT